MTRFVDGTSYVYEMRERRWLVREPDESLDEATEVLAPDADDAAQAACQLWWDAGRWAGEVVPESVHAIVREPDGVEWSVIVTLEWDPTFNAGHPFPTRAEP